MHARTRFISFQCLHTGGPDKISDKERAAFGEKLLETMTFHQTDEHVSIQLDVCALSDGGIRDIITPTLTFEVRVGSIRYRDSLVDLMYMIQ